MNLGGLVDSVRICGFSESYTHKLVQKLFDLPQKVEDLKHYSYRIAPSNLWPRLHGQTSRVDVGERNIVLDDQILPGPQGLLVYSTGPVVLPPPSVNLQSGET